ncbi:acetolactate synthase [Fusarium pseudoanthophilum]|uniref:Acetolactate synthase n=1 Tax=Fusarium pseudoanthophilum TaxID=48495 RepID=A0A8H5NPN3_9HYPO|nr:acetolactate synthase [Fusarium pseudoanthophilum]
MLRTRQAAKAIRAVANARSFTTTSAVASVHTSKKGQFQESIYCCCDSMSRRTRTMSSLCNPRKNDMDESFIGKTGGEIFHEMMLTWRETHLWILAVPFSPFSMPSTTQSTSTLSSPSKVLATAEGYARASGKPGVVLVTSGPGATNVITLLLSKRPMLSVFLACTKWNVMVKNVAELPRRINEAFEIATSGRPGPVLVDLPKDVTAGVLRRAIPTETALPSLPSAASRAAMDVTKKQLEGALQRVGNLVNKAKKPIIYAGQGIILSEGGPEILKELADKSSIPVTTTLQGLGAYDELDENIAKFAPGAKAAAAKGCGGIVHFKIMPKNINKVVQVTEAIEGDVATNLKELLPLIESKTMDDRKEWFNKINEWKKKWPLTDYERAERSGLIKPQTLIEELSNLVADRKDQTYIATGVGQHQMWTAQHFRWRHPRSMITSGGLGTMGYGLPAAIGAKVAQPDALVIDIDGDASFNMTLTKLSTAAQFNIGIKVIILNNEEQGMVTQWQNIFYEDRYAHTHQSNPDFIKLAEAMRVQNRRVSKPEDVVDALKWLINTDGPALLEVVTDKKVPVLPMVPVGSGLHEFLVFDGAKDKKRRELMRERTCGLHG